MPNPMALVASLCNKQFMKNHKFRRHIAENGVQNHENADGTYATVLLGPHFTPTPCFRTLYLDLPIKMQKNYNNSKSTWHTKFSHIALQSAYPKTYMCRFASLCKHFFPVQIDFFSVFCQGEFRKQPKFYMLLILTGKNTSKWHEWCVFRV